MMYFRWLLLTPIGLVATLFGILFCWLFPLFAIGKKELPQWLSWAGTPDNPIDGDISYQTLHAPFKDNLDTLTEMQRYINRTMWLLRNPAYGFAWSVLATTPPKNSAIITIGDATVNDGVAGKAGWYLSTTTGAFRFRTVIPTIKGHCFMMDCGWCMPQCGLTDGTKLLFYGINLRFPSFR